MIVAPGQTSVKDVFQLVDDSGIGIEPMDYSSLPTVVGYVVPGSPLVVVTPVALDDADSAYTPGGVFGLGYGGFFRFDWPDGAVPTTANKASFLIGEETGKHIISRPLMTIQTAAEIAAALTDQDITIVSAWSGSTLTIHKGAAYSVGNGRSVDYALPSPVPDLTGGAAKFRMIADSGEELIEHTLTLSGEGTASQKAIWELPAEKSNNVRPPTQGTGFILYKAAAESEFSIAYEFTVQARRL